RLLSSPWLMCADQAAIQRTRAKRDIQVAISDRLNKLRRFLKWRREIGVGKESDWRSCSKQSRAHRRALSAIRKILQQTCTDLRGLQSIARDCSRCIGRSVIHDDHLAFRRIGGEIIESEPERMADAGFFVKTWNDNRKRRKHRHR